MEVALRTAWARDGGRSRAAADVLDDLLGRYREPHRHYHTLRHVAAVLATCDELVAQVPVADPAAVRLAAWFHDAVYDPRSAGNEAASAALAQRQLVRLDQPASRVEAVARLVLATATHEAGGTDEAVLLDADLAVLAERPAVYAAYATGVRAEYAHLDDESWRAGRAAVLQSLLDRPAIFRTAPMLPREAHARANLAAELAELTPHRIPGIPPRV